MLEISNTRIYDLKECVIASRNTIRLPPDAHCVTKELTVS